MKRANKNRSGFTLVELMMVVGIIGLLAAIALPQFGRYRENAFNGRFVGDMRVATSAFEMYYAEHGQWPADTTPRVVPSGMADYLCKMNWTEDTAIGGQWDWDRGVFGVDAGVSVYRPKAKDPQLLRIDRQADDGDLFSGNWRKRSSGYINLINP